MVIILNQFFWPDAAATSQLLSDASNEVARWHPVTAICASSAYASAEGGSAPAVRVWRTKSLTFVRGKLGRPASYGSFLIGAAWHALRCERSSIFVTLTTPPLLPVVAAAVARCRGSRHVIWEMDVYPDIATDIGFFRKGGLVDRFCGSVLDWSRRRADAIIALGEDMKARLVARGVSPSKIHIVENWADGDQIRPRPFPDGTLTIYYSGNLGLAHETDTVTAAIGRLRQCSQFRFVFAGAGARRTELEKLCRDQGLGNVQFKPYCDREDLGRSLAEGHVGLVTQLPETLGSIVPSKVYGIMAAGRPILYIGPAGSTPAAHIRKFGCGWHILPGDVNGLLELLTLIDSKRQLIYEAGARARIAFERNFERRIGVSRVASIVLNSSSQLPSERKKCTL